MPAIEKIKTRLPTLHLSLPSNRVDTGPVALTAAANARQSSITLAPEAATQRMRDIICKTITDEMIEHAIEAAFQAGYTSLKMYFMIGLPRETHAEVQGIVDLGIRAREIGRRVRPGGGRFSVHVSVSNFVPKPHTPFQWEGMSRPRAAWRPSRRTCAGRCPPRQIRLSLHDLRTSMLEGALARGDEEIADVIESAWRAGARFDAWTRDVPGGRLGGARLRPPARASTSRRHEEFGEWDELPWDHVQLGHLQGVPAGRVVAEPRRGGDGRLPLGRMHRLRCLLRPRPQQIGDAERSTRTPRGKLRSSLKYRITFAVTGRARFLSHLETVDTLLGALRRAGLRHRPVERA